MIFKILLVLQEYQDPEKYNQGVYLSIEQSLLLILQGMIPLFKPIFICPTKIEMKRFLILKKPVKSILLLRDFKEDQMDLTLMGEIIRSLLDLRHKKSMISFTIIIQLRDSYQSEEATFTKENDTAKMTIVVQNLGIDKIK